MTLKSLISSVEWYFFTRVCGNVDFSRLFPQLDSIEMLISLDTAQILDLRSKVRFLRMYLTKSFDAKIAKTHPPLALISKVSSSNNLGQKFLTSIF